MCTALSGNFSSYEEIKIGEKMVILRTETKLTSNSTSMFNGAKQVIWELWTGHLDYDNRLMSNSPITEIGKGRVIKTTLNKAQLSFSIKRATASKNDTGDILDSKVHEMQSP